MESTTNDADALLDGINKEQADKLREELEEFLIAQSEHFRPVCLVSSGGTAADLEVNSVRCLDNFSTGLRGAIAVEEFLQRGYAVVHLWRTGSTSPFARVVNQHLQLPQTNHTLNMECLDRLFAGGKNDDLVQTVLQEEEADWRARESEENLQDHDRKVHLHHSMENSSKVQAALQQKLESTGRILTVPFRSVDEYLAKLQLCSVAMRPTGSLAMFFLAAAVSDFYVPLTDRSHHKIQSTGEGLTLNLKPVPKVLGVLRKKWAPEAFVVSFKLETDEAILREKSERAVERYGCHMVIGNLLHNRHDRVSILAPHDFNLKDPNTNATNWSTQVITKEESGGGSDSLESAMADVVAQAHLEFISYHHHHQHDGWKRSREMIVERKIRLRRRLFWRNVKDGILDVSGVLLALALSYTINTVLQNRLRNLPVLR